MPRSFPILVDSNGRRYAPLRASDRAIYVVGRAEGCDLRIEDDRISSRHAQFLLRGGVWIIRDLGSTNGTTVEGRRLEGDHPVPVTNRAAIQLGPLSLRVQFMGEPSEREPAIACVVGNSDSMVALRHSIKQAAQHDRPVAIVGESGTGKELVARAIHESSPRGSGPMITLNCAAIPEPLVESELFGHRKGAFTGANEDKSGLFEQAEGGSLLLDEVAAIPLVVQAKLLRAVQESGARRVGDHAHIKTDVRVLATSARDLEREVRAGTFREDLYHRLSARTIHTPPLRDHLDDIPEIVAYFVNLHRQRYGETASLSDDAVRLLGRQAWPGNVRELGDVLARVLASVDGPIVTSAELAPYLRPRPASRVTVAIGSYSSDADVALLQSSHDEGTPLKGGPSRKYGRRMANDKDEEDDRNRGGLELDGEEAEAERRFLGSRTPEETERLRRLNGGDPIPALLLDLESEAAEVERRFLASRTSEELGRLQRLNDGDDVGGRELTPLLDG